MKSTIYLVILIIIFCLAFYGGYNYNQPEVIHTSDTIVKYDSIIRVIPVQHIITHIDSFEVEVPAKFDTLEVIQKYFTKKEYTRTFRDSSIFLSVKDSLYMNRIIYTDWQYKILRPTTNIINTTTTNIYTKYITINALISSTISPSIGITYTDKRYSYMFIYSPLNKEYKYSVGVGYNIWKK